MGKRAIVLLLVLNIVNLCAQTPSIEKYWCPRGHFNVDQRTFIMKLAELVQPRSVLETGFCMGRSSASVLCASSSILFISVDIDLDYMKPEGREYAIILQNDFPNCKVIEADSKRLFTQKFIMEQYPEGIDWLTIDGDHSYQGCLADLEVARHLNEAGIVIIDDYKSGPPNGVQLPQVTKAVEDFALDGKPFLRLGGTRRVKVLLY